MTLSRLSIRLWAGLALAAIVACGQDVPREKVEKIAAECERRCASRESTNAYAGLPEETVLAEVCREQGVSVHAYKQAKAGLAKK